MAIDDGGPAFPRPTMWMAGKPGEFEMVGGQDEDGMSLRDWFAGQALISVLDSLLEEDVPEETIPLHCYQIADAMLKARKPDAPA